MRRPALRLVVVAIAMAAAFPAGEAAADELTDARARAATSFHRGQAAYARHDYAGAGEAFDLAAGFDPNPVPLLDAADAWALAGEPVRAAEDCDRALAMPSINEAQRHFATKQLESLRSAVATIDVRGAGEVLVGVDGSADVPTPVHRRVAPGRHQVRMREARGDHRDQQEVTVRGGETATVEPRLQPDDTTRAARSPAAAATPAPSAPAPEAPDASAPHGGRGVPTATWIAFGGGAAALVPFTIFGVQTLNVASDYNAVGSPKTGSMRDAYFRDRALTDVFLGLAAAGAITGGLLWIVTPSSTVAVGGQAASFELHF